MVEINPLVVTTDGHVFALDAKFNFDDNALYRQPEIVAMRDKTEEDPREVAATEFNLNYIGLDGNIACLVNGAGLAMATMDIIKHFGGEPANFLDVGGGASKEQVTAAFKIILGDPNVKGILVNIFGGIMDCNIIATGIVAAAKEIGLHASRSSSASKATTSTPAKPTLADSGLAIITADDHGRRRPEDRRRRRQGLTRRLRHSTPSTPFPMAILVDENTKSSSKASPATSAPATPSSSLDYGTQVVAGVTPGKGGQIFEHDARCRSSTPSPKPCAKPAPPSPRSSSRRPSPPTPSSKRVGRRARPRRLHHRRHSGQRHDAGEGAMLAGCQDPPHRPELPRPRHPRHRREIATAAAASASPPATSTSAATSASSPAAARSPTKPSGSSPRAATARAPASASAATRSTAPPTSTC